LNLIPAAAGTVRLLGQDHRRFRNWPCVGYVSQASGGRQRAFPASVLEIVASGLLAHKRFPRRLNRADQQRVEQVLELMEITDLRDAMIARLSGGQRQRALLAGFFIAMSCSSLGPFLVLQRFALIGDGLAHVAFGTIGLGLLLQTQLLVISIPLVMLASYWILLLSERAGIQGDAAIGLVSAMGVATGVMPASVSSGFNVDLLSYLFGSILAISSEEVILRILLSLVVLGVAVLDP
jgi:hypothetical protein